MLSKAVSVENEQEKGKEKGEEKGRAEREEEEEKWEGREAQWLGNSVGKTLTKTRFHTLGSLIYSLDSRASPALLFLQANPPASAPLILYLLSSWQIQNFMRKFPKSG